MRPRPLVAGRRVEIQQNREVAVRERMRQQARQRRGGRAAHGQRRLDANDARRHPGRGRVMRETVLRGPRHRPLWQNECSPPINCSEIFNKIDIPGYIGIITSSEVRR